MRLISSSFVLFVVLTELLDTNCCGQANTFPQCRTNPAPGYCMPYTITGGNVGQEDCGRTPYTSPNVTTYRCKRNPEGNDYAPDVWSACSTVRICVRDWDKFENMSNGSAEEFKERRCKTGIDMGLKDAVDDVLYRYKTVCSDYGSTFSKFYNGGTCADTFPDLPNCVVQIDMCTDSKSWYTLTNDYGVESTCGIARLPQKPRCFIVLNFTKNFTVQDYPNGVSKRWAEPGGCDCTTLKCKYSSLDEKCIDIESVLLHEFGHIFGLHHMMYCNSTCTLENQMQMEYSNYACGNELGNCDKCGFCALWCPAKCGYTGSSAINGNEYASPMSPRFELYPNPSPQAVNVVVSMPVANADLLVYDELGGIRESRDIHRSGNEAVLILDFAPYPNGTYYVVVTNTFGITSRTVIINR